MRGRVKLASDLDAVRLTSSPYYVFDVSLRLSSLLPNVPTVIWHFACRHPRLIPQRAPAGLPASGLSRVAHLGCAKPSDTKAFVKTVLAVSIRRTCATLYFANLD